MGIPGCVTMQLVCSFLRCHRQPLIPLLYLRPQPGTYEPPPSDFDGERQMMGPLLDCDNVEQLRLNEQYERRVKKLREEKEQHAQKMKNLSLEEYRAQQEWNSLREVKDGEDWRIMSEVEPDRLELKFTTNNAPPLHGGVPGGLTRPAISVGSRLQTVVADNLRARAIAEAVLIPGEPR